MNIEATRKSRDAVRNRTQEHNQGVAKHKQNHNEDHKSVENVFERLNEKTHKEWGRFKKPHQVEGLHPGQKHGKCSLSSQTFEIILILFVAVQDLDNDGNIHDEWKVIKVVVNGGDVLAYSVTEHTFDFKGEEKGCQDYHTES